MSSHFTARAAADQLRVGPHPGVVAAEGHHLDFGSTGENLTLRGLDWTQVRPWLQLLVGTALLVGLAAPAVGVFLVQRRLARL